uniref:OCEL domain-containing protein n=1 Tax=Athene cunicularia TaxID=194338 RepID=A0A663N578_ATHCN
MNKKKRISRLGSGIPSPLRDHFSAFRKKAAAAPPPPPHLSTTSIPAPHLLPGMCLHASNPPKTSSSTFTSTPEVQGTQKLPMDSFSPSSSKACEDQCEEYATKPNLLEFFGDPREPAGMRVKPKSTGKKLHQLPEKVKESKEKDEGKMQDTVSVSMEEKDIRKEETAELRTSSCLDLAIISYEQHQCYKNDFYAEYHEYRDLYALSISQKFMSLDAQRHMLFLQGPENIKKDKTGVLEEDQKLKESSPSYFEKKCRCQYLHNKLSHIKKLIGEFDKQQEELQH